MDMVLGHMSQIYRLILRSNDLQGFGFGLSSYILQENLTYISRRRNQPNRL